MEGVLNDGHHEYDLYPNDEQYILDNDLQDFNLSTFTIVDSVSSSSSGIGGMLKVVGASWVQTRVSWWLLFSITLLGLVALYFGPSYSTEPDGKYAATVYYGKESKFRLEYWGQNNDPADIKPGVARGFYQPDIFKSGWASLEIETQESYPDHLQACAAGMLEGALSWQMILHHWQNTIQKTCLTRQEYCTRTREFLTHNVDRVRRKAEQDDVIDPFWHQVNLFYIQLEGLAQGWRSGIKRSRRDYVDIPWIDFLWMNVMPDLRDLERRFNGTADFNPFRPPLSFVLLKYFPEDPSNFILSHGSSGTYNSMLRIQKRYNFAYHDRGDVDADTVNGQIVTFSSYPGTIFSGDDFYQVRSRSGEQLTVVGTELKNNNQSTWSHEEEETSVLMGPRVMAANRLSRDGDDWSALFTRRNSGTGNKQWLILDTSDNFTAWAVEQMPGLTHAQEVTQRIVEDSHWIACGIPYFQDIQVQSEGFVEGSSLYHLKNLNPLYIALKKYVNNITSVSSVVEVMRSYDISIIGRSDLNGNSNLYGYLNVTASISKHHAHYHRHSGRNSSDVETTTRHAEEENDVRDESNNSGNHEMDISSHDQSAVTQTDVSHGSLEGFAKNAYTKSPFDARLDRPRAAAKQTDFHSANFYEHRDDKLVLNLKNNLVVDKDFQELSASERSGSDSSSEIDKSSVATVGPYVRHKYAGVYRKIENGIKRPRDVSDNLIQHAKEYAITNSDSSSSNRVVGNSDEISSNPGSGDNQSSSSSSGDSQTSFSTNSHESSSDDNQTSVTERSQNSINSSSSTNSNQSSESGSLSSVDKSSSIDLNDRTLKAKDHVLPAHDVPNKPIANDEYSKSIETKVSPKESLPESSSSADSSSQVVAFNLETGHDAQTKKPLDASTSSAHDLEIEHTPKIDIQFRSSKHLLHSKPNVDAPKSVSVGARFINSSKQFRGIIDVKIVQGNGNFIAISGPPYYRPKNSARGNLTAAANSTAPTSATPVDLGASRDSRASVEPFQWSTSNIRHQKHVGQPDLWNFDVFEATWVWS